MSISEEGDADKFTIVRESIAHAIAGDARALRMAQAAQQQPRRSKRPQLNAGKRQDLLASNLFAPRAVPQAPPRRSTKRSPTSIRERFIHAQYRFLLKPNGDYTVHFCDPDLHFAWSEDVLQVIVPTTSALPFGASGDALSLIRESATCPICLCEPTAPRMSRCGHVYCYPCILRYLELSDTGAWRKCPVCQDSMHSKDLKAVRWFDAALAHQLAQDTSGLPLPETTKPILTMRLIERPQMTTLGLPQSGTWPSPALPPNSAPWHFTPDAEAYAHFMLASPELILDSLKKDLEQIQAEERLTRTLAKAQGRGVPTDLEISLIFIASARRKVTEQMEKAEALKTGAVLAARKAALRALAESNAIARSTPLPQPEASTSGGSDADDVPEAYVSTLRGAPPAQGKRRANVNPPPPNDTTFTYYQVASGQNIYLSPLDMKILGAHFGDALPATIHVAVEHHEDKAMTPDIRKRYKHLAHLPTASDITFIEADLSSLVPASALEAFAPQLKSRRNQRTTKARREDRDLRASARRHAEVRATRVPEYRMPSQEEQVIEMPALPSKSPALAPTVDASIDDETSAERTVWGTRAIPLAPSPTLAPTQVTAELSTSLNEHDDEHWRALEQELAFTRAQSASEKPASGGKRKKKGVTMSLTGGGR